MGFFIHIADPGFPEPPWVNERRLGPYDTDEEAANQAVHDLATGFLAEDNFLGVFDDENSELRDQRPAKAKAAIIPSKLKPRAATIRRKAHAQRLRDLQDQQTALEELLPEGVTIADLLAHAKVLRATAQTRAEEDAD